jgi:hypothetical protein
MAVIQCPHCSKPVMAPDAPSLPTGLANICQQWPEFCAIVKTQTGQLNTIARNVADLIDAKNGHPAPTKEFIVEHWLNCPDCSVKFQALLKEYPELFKTKGKARVDDRPFYAKPNFGVSR